MATDVQAIHDQLLAGLQQLKQHTDDAAARDQRLEAKVDELKSALATLQQQVAAQGATVSFDDVTASVQAIDGEVSGIAPESQAGAAGDSTAASGGGGTTGGTGAAGAQAADQSGAAGPSAGGTSSTGA
jgi:hypothetical protein